MLARHDRTAQIDRRNPVEYLLSEFVERFVSAANTDAYIIVQDVDASPAGLSGLDRLGKALLAGNVGLERHTLAALPHRHCRRLRGRADQPVDGQDFSSFASETKRRSAPVAYPFAWALAGADDDGDLAFKTHVEPALSPESHDLAFPLFAQANLDRLSLMQPLLWIGRFTKFSLLPSLLSRAVSDSVSLASGAASQLHAASCSTGAGNRFLEHGKPSAKRP